MISGLTNLSTLKAWLLPASLVDGGDYDDHIAVIGKGVAGQLESHCNRKFARTLGDVFECTADREHLVLPRYPVEQIISLEMQFSLAEGWQAQTPLTDVIWNQALDRGLVYFGFRQAPNVLWRMRLTFDGGFWIDDTEDNSGTLPDGATAMPDSLLLAWKLQCEHVWQQRDKLGISVGEKPATSPALAAIELLPAVKDHLREFIRYTLT
jgi:hypothetical protein